MRAVELVVGKRVGFKVKVWSDVATNVTLNQYFQFEEVIEILEGVQPQGKVESVGFPSEIKEVSVIGEPDPEWLAAYMVERKAAQRRECDESYDPGDLREAGLVDEDVGDSGSLASASQRWVPTGVVVVSGPAASERASPAAVGSRADPRPGKALAIARRRAESVGSPPRSTPCPHVCSPPACCCSPRR